MSAYHVEMPATARRLGSVWAGGGCWAKVGASQAAAVAKTLSLRKGKHDWLETFRSHSLPNIEVTTVRFQPTATVGKSCHIPTQHVAVSSFGARRAVVVGGVRAGALLY